MASTFQEIFSSILQGLNKHFSLGECMCFCSTYSLLPKENFFKDIFDRKAIGSHFVVCKEHFSLLHNEQAMKCK